MTREFVPMFGNPATCWLRWFAWTPTKTWDQRWRWLCWVERRLIVRHPYITGGQDTWWQVRVIPARPRQTAEDGATAP